MLNSNETKNTEKSSSVKNLRTYEPQPTPKTVHEFLYVFSLRHYIPVLVKQPFVLLIIQFK